VNKVVARYIDGRLVKGMTADFFPNKDRFHVYLATAPGDEPVEIVTTDLKALFFVKDFDGDPDHVERNEFDPARPPAGRALRVVFRDGEVLVGVTTGYQPGRPGFFITPADEESNVERAYIVASSTTEVSFI